MPCSCSGSFCAAEGYRRLAAAPCEGRGRAGSQGRSRLPDLSHGVLKLSDDRSNGKQASTYPEICCAPNPKRGNGKTVPSPLRRKLLIYSDGPIMRLRFMAIVVACAALPACMEVDPPEPVGSVTFPFRAGSAQQTASRRPPVRTSQATGRTPRWTPNPSRAAKPERRERRHHDLRPHPSKCRDL